MVTIAELVMGPMILFSEVYKVESSDVPTLATTKEREDADAAFANVGEGPPSLCVRVWLYGLGIVV